MEPLTSIVALLVLSVVALLALLAVLKVPVRYALEAPGAMRDPGFAVTLEGLTNSSSRGAHGLKLYGTIDEGYAAGLEAIRGAQASVTFETYLFWSGQVADAFIEAFCERARAGVAVKLLFDADGCRFLWPRDVKRLSEAGCEVRFFRPFRWHQPFQYNHRTHRKILVVDGRIGFTGGAGVADMWLGPPAWLETLVRMEGSVVALLQGAFFQNWVVAGGGLNLSEAYFPAREDPPDVARGMVTTSSPLWGDSTMRLLFFGAITAAGETLDLMSPYFLPNGDTTRALAAAARRGVRVRVMVPGPKNDKAIPYYASRLLYGRLLKAGVRIYEYAPAMMHAKAMVVDGCWTTLGSANFDPRSFFLNSELNVSLDDTAFAAEVTRFFETALVDCREVGLAEWRARGWHERVLGSIGLVLKDQL